MLPVVYHVLNQSVVVTAANVIQNGKDSPKLFRPASNVGKDLIHNILLLHCNPDEALMKETIDIVVLHPAAMTFDGFSLV